MKTQPRTLQRWLSVVVVAPVAGQFLLAGAGAFHATSFQPHTALGWAIGFGSVLVLLVALAARNERPASAALFATVVVQIALALLGTHSSAWFGALHGLNAVTVLGAAGNLARRTAA